MYVKYLQKSPLGLEVLQQIVSMIGEADAPAKIKMIYLLAHELYLVGQNPLNALQESMQANFGLKNKVVIGYRCGIVLAQLTNCPRLA